MSLGEVCQQSQAVCQRFDFLKTHIRHKVLRKLSDFKFPAHGASASVASTSPELIPTLILWRSACDQTPQYNLQLQAPVQ